MYTATKDLILATTITGSLPRPSWYIQNLSGRPFRVAMAEKNYREQYLDAVSCYIRDQERAGLDIVTDGDARFDTDVGGRSWMGYALERLQGVRFRSQFVTEVTSPPNSRASSLWSSPDRGGSSQVISQGIQGFWIGRGLGSRAFESDSATRE